MVKTGVSKVTATAVMTSKKEPVVIGRNPNGNCIGRIGNMKTLALNLKIFPNMAVLLVENSGRINHEIIPSPENATENTVINRTLTIPLKKESRLGFQENKFLALVLEKNNDGKTITVHEIFMETVKNKIFAHLTESKNDVCCYRNGEIVSVPAFNHWPEMMTVINQIMLSEIEKLPELQDFDYQKELEAQTEGNYLNGHTGIVNFVSRYLGFAKITTRRGEVPVEALVSLDNLKEKFRSRLQAGMLVEFENMTRRTMLVDQDQSNLFPYGNTLPVWQIERIVAAEMLCPV